MGIFTFKHSEQYSELEKALQGVPFSEDIKFDYSGQGTEKDKVITSPVYLLPVDAYDNVVYGHFTIDGKLAEVPIGFLRRINFLFKEHFRPQLNGNLVKEDRPNDGTIYLPMKLTDLLLKIGVQKEGTFVLYEGSPFSIFGVEGSQGKYPLILVSETEERIMCKGLYKAKDDLLLTYDHQGMRPSDKQIREVLRTLRGYKLTEKKGMVETANPHIATALSPSLETITKGEINWEEPKSIVAYLNEYVIGQDDAKMIIAVAFSNYMTKVRTKNDDLQKDNLLLIGPSGVGKTLMISLLAKKASLPMVQTKLTGKSTEGYKGENLSSVFEQMRVMTTGEAPYGIIFFDEIDKLSYNDDNNGGAFGTRLQDELIGWVEEAIIVGDRNNAQKELKSLNTKNILFVTAGAFHNTSKDSSLAGIIRKRLGKGQKSMGFGAIQEQKENNEEYILPKVRPEDLITYGLKPELVGRLPSLAVLRPLTIEDKVKILTSAKRSSITNYIHLLSLKGYPVEIDPAVPEVIARCCPEETGARALNAVCNDLFTEIMFDPQQYANDKKIIRVTPELARKLINLYA